MTRSTTRNTRRSSTISSDPAERTCQVHPPLYVTMAGRPPAKSNRYKLEWSRRLRRWVIAKDDEVKGYERALGEQTKLLLNRLGVDPPWFPKHVDLELTILWHRGDDNARHRKDVGNIEKSIQDALNRL